MLGVVVYGTIAWNAPLRLLSLAWQNSMECRRGASPTPQDIKASNLLLKLDPQQPKGIVLKLADFGFSRCVLYRTRCSSQGAVPSASYTCPSAPRPHTGTCPTACLYSASLQP